VFAEIIQEKISGIVDILPSQLSQLQWHYELLLRWNRVINLTSIAHPEEIIERHFCESLFLGVHLPSGKLSAVDIGSGGGFPGLPVAVLRPDCTFTLVESRQRKAAFLNEVSRSLSNVQVLARRVEQIDRHFEWGLSRAVSYEDLGTHLKRISAHAALLTGSEKPPQGSGFQWDPEIAVPWGNRRFLRIGQRK
jgi:16S rRNA (guanine527-N7)-methyltransferase